MRCNRRKNDDDCPCCNRAAERLSDALDAMLRLWHQLASLDVSADVQWRNLLGDPKAYRRAVTVLGRDSIPSLDDMLPASPMED